MGIEVRENILKASRHVSQLADAVIDPLPFKPISADSHVTEPPNCYLDYIDPRYRERAPHVEFNASGGAVYFIEGVNDGKPYMVSVGGMASAGVNPKDIDLAGWTFDDIPRGGFDGNARIAEQDADGVGGEVIFPTVGMVLCNHPDADFKHACFQAYNRWLQEFQAAAPERIFGLGQSAVLSIEQTVRDLQDIREMGFCGAMFPCEPATEFEFDDPRFDPVWQAATELNLSIAFHVRTSRREARANPNATDARGRSMAFHHHAMIRANQDVISTFIWGRVFERFPALRLVCAEADAGWAPHFMYRLDHFYHRHRFHQNVPDMERLPSEQFADNVYMTFQDDVVAMNSLNMLNPRRMLWANDFPHSDSTWPWSQQLLTHQSRHMTEQEKQWVFRDNAIEAFNLPIRA